jgi:hypothetical protein
LYIADTKLFSASCVLRSMVGVFANAKEIVECCDGEVANRLGFWRGGVEAVSDAPVWDTDWDCELGLRDWIVATVAFDLLG